MHICFLIGSADIGGGSYVVFQHAMHAMKAGHEVAIVSKVPSCEANTSWHPAARLLNFISLDRAEKERFDIVIATWWETALDLARYTAKQYSYFVQSIESKFYPESHVAIRELADSTLDLGLPVLTEATWIRDRLKTETSSHFLVRNGIRKELYTPEGPCISPRWQDGRVRVLVEGPLGVPYKNVARTIRLVREANPDDLWLLTTSDVPCYPGVARTFSRIAIQQVPEIYRSCDVIVKLSYVEGMFGPPLEMFHCGGTAIVYDVTGHDEYIVDGFNALLVETDDEAKVVDSIRRLRSDAALLSKLKRGALRTADQWPDWATSSTQFLAAIQSMMDLPAVTCEDLAEKTARALENYCKKAGIRSSLAKRPFLKTPLLQIRQMIPEAIRRPLRWLHFWMEALGA